MRRPIESAPKTCRSLSMQARANSVLKKTDIKLGKELPTTSQINVDPDF